MRLKSTLIALCLAATTAFAFGCDDSEDSDPADTTETADAVEDATAEDTTEADTAEPDAEDDAEDAADASADATSTDATDAEGDTSDVWTDPARFFLIFLDAEVGREVVYMVGARQIAIPDVQIEAESLQMMPIVGQTVAIDHPQNSITPAESVTGDDGRTEVLQLTLTDDMTGPTATHTFVPYIPPNTPDPVRTIAVLANGLDVISSGPVDVDDNPIAPIADGGASTWTYTVDLARADSNNTDPLPEGLEIEIEFITNVGEPPLEFVETTEDALRWSVADVGTTRTVDFRASGSEAGDARFFVRLYQGGGLRGQRTETVTVEAAP